MENLPTLKSVPKRLELFKEQDEQELPVEADQAPPIQVAAIKSEPVIPSADDPVTKIYLEECLNKVAELGNSERFRKNQTNPTDTSAKVTSTKTAYPGTYSHPGKKLKVKCQLTEKLLILEQIKSPTCVSIQKEMLEAATKCGCHKEVASVFLEDKPLPLVKEGKSEEMKLVKSEPVLEGSNNQSAEKPESEMNKISIPISYLTFSFMVLLQQCFDLQFSGGNRESDFWMRIKTLLKNMSELKSNNLRDLRYYLRLYSSGNINQESEYEKHLQVNHPTLYETLVTNTRHVVDGSQPAAGEDSNLLASIEEDTGEDPAGDADETNTKKSKKSRQSSSAKKNSSTNASKPTKKGAAKSSIFADDSEGDATSRRYYLSKLMLVGHQPETLIESSVFLLLPAFIESKKMILIYGNDTDFPELDLVIRRTLAECLPKLEVKFINHDAATPPANKPKEDSDGTIETTTAPEANTESTPKETSEDQFIVEFFSAKSLRSRNGLNLKTGPSGLLLHRTAATTMKDSAKCREIMAQAYRTIASDFKVYRPKLSESCRRGKTNALVPFAADLDELWCHLLSYSITLDLARIHEYESSTLLTKRSFAKVYKVDSDRRTDFERLEKFISAHLLDEDTAEQGLENIPAHLHKTLPSEQSKSIKNVLVWRFDTSSPEQDKANVSLEIDKLQKMVQALNTAEKEGPTARNFELIDLSNQKGYQADQKAHQFLSTGVTEQTYATTKVYLLHGKFIPLMLYDLEFSMMICLGNATYLADFRNFLRHAYQTKPNISLLLFHASKSDNFFEKPLITSTFLKGGSLESAQIVGGDLPLELGEAQKKDLVSVLKAEDCVSNSSENQGLIYLRAAIPEKPTITGTVLLKEIADFVGIHSSVLVPPNPRLSRSYKSTDAYRSRFAEFLPVTPEPVAIQATVTEAATETPVSRQPTTVSKSSRQKITAQISKKDGENSKQANSKITAEQPDEGQDSVFLSGAEDKEAEKPDKTETSETTSVSKKTKKKKNRDKEQPSDSNTEEKKKEGKKKAAEAVELQSPSEDSSVEPKQKSKKKSKKMQEHLVSLTMNNSDDSSRESSQKKKDKKKAKKLKKKRRQAQANEQSQAEAEQSGSDHQESDPEKFLKKRKQPSPSKKPEAKQSNQAKKDKDHLTTSPRPSRNLMIQTPNSGSNSTDEVSGAHNQKYSEEMDYQKEDSDSEGFSQPEDLENMGQQLPMLPMIPHQIQPLCLEIDEHNESITMALESRDNLLEKLKSLARRTQIPAVLELALKKTRESGPTLRIPFLKCSAHFLGFLRDHFELKPAKILQRPLWEAIMHLIPHQPAKIDIWDPAIKRVPVPAALEQNMAALASNMLPKALVYADQPEILMGACLLSVIHTLRETGNLVIICGEKSALHEWLSVLRIAFQPECFMNDAQYAQSQMGVSKKLPKIELISLEHSGLDGLTMRSKEENTIRQRHMDPLKKLDDSHLREIWKIYVTVSSTQKDWEANNFNILSHAVIFYKTDKNMPEGGVVSQICNRAKKMVFAQPVKHFISAKLGLYPNKLQAMYPHLANLSTSMQILTQSLLSIRLAKLFNIKGALHEVRIFSLEQLIFMSQHDLRRGKSGHHPATSSSRPEPFAITAIFDLLEYWVIKNQFERVAIWSFTPQEKETNKIAVERFLRETKPQGNWEVLDCYQPNLHPRARDTVNNKKLKHIIFLGGPDPADLPVYSIPFDLFVFVNPPKFTESFKAYIRCLSLIKKLQVVFLGQCHYSAFRFSNQNGKWNDANPEQVSHIQDQYLQGISRDPASSILKLTGTVRVPTYSGPVRIWEWPDKEPESVVITNQNSGGMREAMMYRATDYQMNYSQSFARTATFQPPYMQQMRGMNRGRGRPRGSRASNRPAMDTGYSTHMGMSRPPPGYTYPTAAFGQGQGMAYGTNLYGPRGGMPAYPTRGMPAMGYGHLLHPGQMPQPRGGHMPGYPGFAMPMYGPNSGMPASSSSYQMMGHDQQRGGFMRGPRGGSTGHEGFYSKPYQMTSTPTQPISKAADEEVFVEEIEGGDNNQNQNASEQGWEGAAGGPQMQYITNMGTASQKTGGYPGLYQGVQPHSQNPGGYGALPNAYQLSPFGHSQQFNEKSGAEGHKNQPEEAFSEEFATADQNQHTQIVAEASQGGLIDQPANQDSTAAAN